MDFWTLISEPMDDIGGGSRRVRIGIRIELFGFSFEWRP